MATAITQKRVDARTSRILIAEDERTLAHFLRSALEEEPGYEVEVRHSGEDALEAVAERQPDVIIADLRMPGLSGIQLLRAARGLQTRTQAILMTAYGCSDVEAEAERVGVSAYVSKPFEMEEMKQLVRRAVRIAKGGPNASR